MINFQTTEDNMNVLIEVKVLPRPEILDVQGRAIMQTLEQNDQFVKDCRYGKCIQLSVQAENEEKAKAQVKKIAEFILYNPLTETYELNVIS